LNLFELFVKIGAKDEASGTISKITSGLGKGLATAAKIGTAAVGAAAAGITALTTAAVNSFAEYEQLAGGAQKIFDQMDYSKIAADANNAYKELGLSANQYLAVINDVGATFAATMGDEAGYETAKTGLKAISDYASGTGKNVDELSQKFTLITRSTSSYQSIADQFSGILPATSDAFLEQAQAAGILSDNYTKLTEVPIDEYQAAVSQMLQQGVADLGLTGNTAEEAFSTISGSITMTRAAWSNLVTGIANGSANIKDLVLGLVTSAGAVLENLGPVVEDAFEGITVAVQELIPELVESLPAILEESFPILVDSALSLVDSLLASISENQESIIQTVFNVVTNLANSLLSMLPTILQLGFDILGSLATGIQTAIPTLIPQVVNVVVEIAKMLSDTTTLQTILDAAVAIIQSLVEYILAPGTIEMLLQAVIGIIDGLVAFLQKNLSPLLSAAIDIIMSLVYYILTPENLAMLVEAAVQIVVAIAGALVGSVGELLKAGGELISKLIDKFKKTDWKQLGKAVMDGMKKGMENAWKNLKEWFSGLFKDIIGVAKKILGIKSPSRVFRDQIGKQMVLGLKHGWDDNFDAVKKDINNSLDFNDVSVGVGFSSGSIRKSAGSIGGTTIGNITINIDGAKYEDETVLAMTIAETIQNMADRRAAAYA
jgi:hypothetical protein